MKTQSVVIFTFILFCFLNESILCAAPSGNGIAEKCSSEFSKVGVCLEYATGKADSPTKECCSTIKDIKEKNAVCLCFIIQQVHDGAATLKQLNLQEDKLVKLPSACNLANASVSECPKLLGLAPNSPDYSIFTKPSSTSAPATPATGTSPMPKKEDSSAGFMQGPLPTRSLIAIVIAITTITIFITAFPV